jgi:hypothetical protein
MAFKIEFSIIFDFFLKNQNRLFWSIHFQLFKDLGLVGLKAAAIFLSSLLLSIQVAAATAVFLR